MVRTQNRKSAPLTKDLDLHRGLGLLVAALRHALVDAGVVHVGVVDGEGGGGFVVAVHLDVGVVWQDLFAVGGEPVDVFGVSHH